MSECTMLHSFLKLKPDKKSAALTTATYPVHTYALTGDSALLALSTLTGTPIGILLDRLTEYPEECAAPPTTVAELVEGLRSRYPDAGPIHRHRWEDVSYHGSPNYKCKDCNIPETDPKSTNACRCSDQMLAYEAANTENKERNEYEQMKYQRDRWLYLRAKYGSPDDPN